MTELGGGPHGRGILLLQVSEKSGQTAGKAISRYSGRGRNIDGGTILMDQFQEQFHTSTRLTP